MTAHFLGDDIISIDAPDATEAQSRASALRSLGVFREVAPGLDSLAVSFDPLVLEGAEALRLIDSVMKRPATQAAVEPTAHILRVRYGGADGPDLESVCATLAVEQDAFIESHCTTEHQVDMIGFTPGFAYLSGVPTDWPVPRLASPRERVDAGSVGVIAGYTGLYAMPGPGGWPIIGRTDAALFDRYKDQPFLIQPGDRVRFEAV
ncbi:MAG: carboxyltransferase domain-containing protein [Pseudomonadota bacterium]